MSNELIELINEIYKMSGNNITEKILDYCETYDQDPREIGEILSESSDFTSVLYKDCVTKHLIKDDDYLDHLTATETIDEW